MTMTIGPLYTIVFVGLSETNTIGYVVHYIFVASGKKPQSLSLAQKKCCVTAKVSYANASKSNDRLSHFPKGFCAIYARRSVCPCLDL
jgi:hypothetical protein